MPGTARPAGQNGPLNPWWNALIQSLKDQQRASSGLLAARNQGCVVDQWGNTIEVYGTNLLQTVIIGAGYRQPGVQVTTGLTLVSGVAQSGIAKQTNLVTTTITLTKGSSSATAGSSSLVNGMVIGAANVTDPTSGLATPAITPGTTVLSGGGTTSIVLSQVAAESGTALYCAACNFTKL